MFCRTTKITCSKYLKSYCPMQTNLGCGPSFSAFKLKIITTKVACEGPKLQYLNETQNR